MMSTAHKRISDPVDYYQGVESPERAISRNVLLFERLSRSTLQQAHLANRMHHRFVFCRVLETAGVVSVDGMGLKVNPGDCLLIAPYQFHNYVDTDEDALRWSFITFELDSGQRWLQGMRDKVLNLDAKARACWDEIIELWISESGPHRQEILPLLDRLLLYQRLHAIEMGAVHGVAAESSGQHEWVTRIEGLIIESVREGWSLEEVARRAKLSERHLRSRFESTMGIPPRDYRANYQMHRAISLMRNSELMLSDIAELSGFNSLSAFSRFVRNRMGCSPRELRKQIIDA